MKYALFSIILSLIFGCDIRGGKKHEKFKTVNLSFHTIFRGEEWSVVYRSKQVFYENFLLDTGYQQNNFKYQTADSTKSDTLTLTSKMKDTLVFQCSFVLNSECDSAAVAISMPFPSTLSPYDSTFDFTKKPGFGPLNIYNSRRLPRVFPIGKTNIIFYK